MDVKIKQNGMDVLNTGSIVVAKDFETIITFDDEFCVKILFSKENKQAIERNPIDNGIELVLKGFNNSLGTCTIAPMPIAKRNEKIVYISLCVHAINDVKLLSYTFLSEV